MDEEANIYWKKILDVTSGIGNISTAMLRDSNEYEFDVCKLMLKGAGGAIFIYPAILKVWYSDESLNILPLVCWGLSLIFGITHLLAWSKKLYALGRNLDRKKSLIMMDAAKTKDVDGLKRVLDDIVKERIKYNSLIAQNKFQELEEKNFKYTSIDKEYSIYLILLQLIFIIFGACVLFDITIRKAVFLTLSSSTGFLILLKISEANVIERCLRCVKAKCSELRSKGRG